MFKKASTRMDNPLRQLVDGGEDSKHGGPDSYRGHVAKKTYLHKKYPSSL